jgi:CheY-like chemotaxis protein
MSLILVIDDYQPILGMLHLMLQSAGYEVFTASDATAVPDLARHLNPDLVLMDVDMPQRSGIAVCEDLKRNPATVHIPVLLTTGRMGAGVLSQAREAGAFGVLTKPFFRAWLLEEVARAISVVSVRR